MKRNLFVSILLAIAVALLVWVIAFAKSPCKKGWDIWYHITGNGTPKCQCFKKDKPPKNPEWKRGCPIVDNPTLTAAPTEPESTPGPGDTPGPDGTPDPGDPPAPGKTPVPTNSSTPAGKNDNWGTFAKITRLKEHTCSTADKHVTIYWIGDLESVVICTHAMDCFPALEPPADGAAINFREHRGTLLLGDYEPGTYWLFAKSASGRSGNETAKSNKLVITK